MKEQWTDKIRQRMETLDVKAPEGLLDDIKAEMARRSIVPSTTRKPHRRTAAMWVWRGVACAAMIALVAGVGTWLMAPRGDLQPHLADSNPKQTVQSVPASSAATTLQATEETIHEGKGGRVQRMMAALMAPSRNVEETSPTTDTTDGNPQPALSTDKQVGSSETTAPTPEKKPVRETKVKRPSDLYGPAGERTLAYTSRNSRGGRITMYAYYQGGIINRAAQPAMEAMVSAPGDLFYQKVEQLMLMASQVRSVETHAHHRLPVKFGLSARYHINDKWSVQSGVTYSYHSSDITTGEQTTEQHLHFVGIPVAASYNVWGNRHVNVYVTAGGEAEKMVKGQSSMVYNGKTIREDVKMSEIQLSAIVAAGAEYKATDRLSIYVEPGATYHFDNGSDIKTYYNDKPLNFSLNVGVRLNVGKR